jgi:dihydrodipicolinate synthase/N-acetylneuraminate lyase
MFEINGVVPIVPTPFAPDGSIDWAALEPLLNFAVDAHVCAVCLPAYANEFYKLRDDERRELVSMQSVF